MERVKAKREEDRKKQIENLYLEEWKIVAEAQQEERRLQQLREKSRKEELRKLERELQQKLHNQIDQLRARLTSDNNRNQILRSAAKRAFAAQVKTAARKSPFYQPSEYYDEEEDDLHSRGFVY